MQDVDVSADCLDILTRVLVAQPSQRMNMEEIKTHPWFLKGLPPGALDMNDFLLQGLADQEEVSLLTSLHVAGDIICVARCIDVCLETVHTSAGAPMGERASDQP